MHRLPALLVLSFALLMAGETRAAVPGEVPDAVAKILEGSPLGGIGRRLRELAPDRPTGMAWAAWAWGVHDRFDKALDVARRARAAGGDPDLLAMVEARAHLEKGRAAEALRVLQAAPAVLASIPGACLEGEIHDRVGRRKEARAAYERAIEAYNQSPQRSREERYFAARAGARNRDPKGALTILAELQQVYPWMYRARFEAGELFRRHYQTGDAELEYEAGLKLRADDPKLLASLALVLFEEGRLSTAEQMAEKALEAHDAEPRAWLVQARIELFREDWAAAKAAAQKALDARPDHPRYLALLAEVHAGAGEPVASADAVRRCLAVNPTYSEVDEALGVIAYRQRRERRALELYTRGIERRPDSSGCLYRRGVLHLHAGRLGAARDDLEKARFLDPFLVPAVNYLKVLDRLETFPAYEIPRGYLALSPRGPSAAAPLFVDGVSTLLGELEQELDYSLSRAHRIEIFHDNTWFNARVQGLPADMLRGVSFGPCLSFSAPELTEPQGGWWRTMRHELVHSFNADRVGDGFLPRWFTEGLAVLLEGKRSERWEAILKGAAVAGSLLPLAELGSAFTRSDRIHLGYMQAGVALEWLHARGGMPAINRCLDLFRSRVGPMEALEQVLGEPRGDLEASYRAFLDARVAIFRGEPVLRSAPPKELMVKAMEDDPEARRRVGWLLLAGGQAGPALEILDGLQDPGARSLIARARAMLSGAVARDELEQAAALAPDDYGLLVALANARLKAGDPNAGRSALRDAHALHPAGVAAAAALFALHEKAGETEEAARVLETLLANDLDNLWALSNLARIREAQQDSPAAAALLRRALEVDSTRPDLALRLARLSGKLSRRAEARAAYGVYAGISRMKVRQPSADPGFGKDRTDAVAQVKGGELWPPPVPDADHRRGVDALAAELAAEPTPGLALAGLADALAREGAETAGTPGPEVDAALERAMHGAWGLEAAHAAAVGRGLALRSDAAGFLWAARSCQAAGPYGRGLCGDAAAEALQALAVRGTRDLERWWGEEGSQGSEAWFESSLKRRGYPPAPPGEDGEAKLLLIVLTDDDWYRSYGARQRLERILGVTAGRGGYRAATHGSRIFEPVRSQAVAAFKRALKERHLARR